MRVAALVPLVPRLWNHLLAKLQGQREEARARGSLGGNVPSSLKVEHARAGLSSHNYLLAGYTAWQGFLLQRCALMMPPTDEPLLRLVILQNPEMPFCLDLVCRIE